MTDDNAPQLGQALYRQALGHARERSFKAAVRLWRQAAGAGHAASQRELGRCYEFGIGTRRNPRVAYDCYRQAAEAGDPEAQYELAVAFIAGTGVRRNYARANQWLRKSVRAGIPEAAHLLGVHLRYAIGVRKDSKPASGWSAEPRRPVSCQRSILLRCATTGARESRGTRVPRGTGSNGPRKAAILGLAISSDVGWSRDAVMHVLREGPSDCSRRP